MFASYPFDVFRKRRSISCVVLYSPCQRMPSPGFEYMHSSLPTVSMRLLIRYRIPTFYLSSLGIQCALRLRQKKLSNYQYGGEIDVDLTRRPLICRAIAPSKDELAHITSLQLLITSMNDIERLAWILEHITALQRLDLEESTAHRVSHLTCYEKDAELFTGILNPGGTSRYPIRLEALRISSMCLEDSEELLRALLDFTSLGTLQLVECKGIEYLLMDLMQIRLCLSSVCIDQRSSGSCDIAILSTFIASLAAPKRISLLCDLEYPFLRQTDVDCLQQQAHSIEYLRLEETNSTWSNYGLSGQARQFYSFLEQASNLRQLALSGPDLEDGMEAAELLVSICCTTILFITTDYRSGHHQACHHAQHTQNRDVCRERGFSWTRCRHVVFIKTG